MPGRHGAPERRREEILKLANRAKRAGYELRLLAAWCSCSMVTLRADLRKLEQEGLVVVRKPYNQRGFADDATLVYRKGFEPDAPTEAQKTNALSRSAKSLKRKQSA